MSFIRVIIKWVINELKLNWTEQFETYLLGANIWLLCSHCFVFWIRSLVNWTEHWFNDQFHHDFHAHNEIKSSESFFFRVTFFDVSVLFVSKWKFHHSSLHMIDNHDLMSNCWMIGNIVEFYFLGTRLSQLWFYTIFYPMLSHFIKIIFFFCSFFIICYHN